jgi:D-cysteine desulfhydrase
VSPEPARLALARLPTPVERLANLSDEVGVDLWVKRDDLTGMELSGNKIRKLEYLLAEARERGARRVHTCGGVQSNHARATAIAARKVGLGAKLWLRGEPPARTDGNLLLDRLVGAEIEFVTPERYRSIDEIMAGDAAREVPPAYPIPEGGSNALGALGYASAVPEILEDEARLGFRFDAVVHATGSGGTTAGLIFGRKRHGLEAEVFGVNVCDDAAFFRDKISAILAEAARRFDPALAFPPEEIRILDGHEGPAYAVPDEAQIGTIRRVARTEGLFLDPVYTGKAFHGLLEELDGGRLAGRERILFVHTGGLFGLFPQADAIL